VSTLTWLVDKRKEPSLQRIALMPPLPRLPPPTLIRQFSDYPWLLRVVRAPIGRREGAGSIGLDPLKVMKARSRTSKGGGGGIKTVTKKRPRDLPDSRVVVFLVTKLACPPLKTDRK